MDILLQNLSYIVSLITGVVGWLVGKRARNNDMLNKMQETIDMLVAKNSKLITEITELRAENAELKSGQEYLKRQLQSFERKYNQKKTISKTKTKKE